MSTETTTLVGDAREILPCLPGQCVQCVVTSPPYFGLRDYGVAGQIGLERTPEAYVAALVGVFREVRRVLADDGVLWLNLGDSYYNCSPVRTSSASAFEKTWNPANTKRAGGLRRYPDVDDGTGLKMKDLMGIPWRVAFALQADGWYLRSDIIWSKPNPMPESVTDRPTKAHEYLFLLAKTERYYYDAESVKEPAVTSATMQIAKRNKRPHKGQTDPGGRRETTGGFDHITKVYETRNRRSVWTITTKPFRGAHFAVMPEDLVAPCVLAGSREGDLVLDPFAGAGTVGVVCKRLRRDFVGIELNPDYVDLATTRISDTPEGTDVTHREGREGTSSR